MPTNISVESAEVAKELVAKSKNGEDAILLKGMATVTYDTSCSTSQRPTNNRHNPDTLHKKRCCCTEATAVAIEFTQRENICNVEQASWWVTSDDNCGRVGV